MFTSFVPSFAADSIPLPPSELWVNRPPLGVHVPPTRAYCRSCINSRLAVYPMDPYCTIHLVYMSSKSSLLCVSIGAVLFRQDLGTSMKVLALRFAAPADQPLFSASRLRAPTAVLPLGVGVGVASGVGRLSISYPRPLHMGFIVDGFFFSCADRAS